VRTGNHTPAQVLAGFVVATACVLLVFRLPL
jgi:membrane-associated phospholipid phosphatase